MLGFHVTHSMLHVLQVQLQRVTLKPRWSFQNSSHFTGICTLYKYVFVFFFLFVLVPARVHWKVRCLHIVTKWQFPFCYFISTSGMYVLHVYLWVYLYSPSIKVHCRATPATLLANQPPASSWYNLSVWTPLFKPLYIARNIFITTINITITMGKSSMNMYIFENLSIFVCVYHSVLLWD